MVLPKGIVHLCILFTADTMDLAQLTFIIPEQSYAKSMGCDGLSALDGLSVFDGLSALKDRDGMANSNSVYLAVVSQ